MLQLVLFTLLFAAALSQVAPAWREPVLASVVESAEKLELPAPVIGFVLPLAASVFKIAAPISWGAGALFVARLYGVSLGFTGLCAIAFAAVFLSDVIPDTFATALNVSGHLAATALVARSS